MTDARLLPRLPKSSAAFHTRIISLGNWLAEAVCLHDLQPTYSGSGRNCSILMRKSD
jgi:hypothetical protein